MLDFFFDIIDGIVACFTRNLSFNAVIKTYWFLFFIEFPRYYLIEFCIAIWHKITYQSRARKRAVARMKLYIENPLITIPVIVEKSGMSRTAIQNAIRLLKEQGRIERIGSKRNGHWEVMKQSWTK